MYVSHCYGSIHVLRHLKLMKERRELDCVGGVMMVALGVTAPASLGIVTRTLPAFVLGESGDKMEKVSPTVCVSSHCFLLLKVSESLLIALDKSCFCF